MAERAEAQPLPLARAGALLTKRGWLPQVLGVITIVLIGGGVLLNHYLSDLFSADQTALAYVSALQSRDANAAWSYVTMSRLGMPKVDADLATEDGLAAQLKHGGLTISAPHITARRQIVDGALVTSVCCTPGGASHTLDLTMAVSNSKHFGIYPAWSVVEEPALLVIAGPAGTVQVDGISVPAKARQVAVLPGPHVLTTPASALFAAGSVAVDARTPWDTPTQATLQPQLSAAGRASAAKAIQDAVNTCPSTPFADSCVQFVNTQYTGEPWQVIGDPAADLSITVGSDGQIVGAGHLQSVYSHSTSSGTAHIFWGGPYTAQLATQNADFLVKELALHPSGGRPLQRPAQITDDAVRAAVSQGFAACAASTSGQPPDCPNRAYVPGATVTASWQLSGDPLQGASVSFDGDRGLFVVRGTYTMSVQYTWHDLFTGGDDSGSSGGAYQAIAVVDSGQLRLISIGAS
jgi:hypothetical protein